MKYLASLPSLPIETCTVNESKWDSEYNVLDVYAEVAAPIKLKDDERKEVVKLFDFLEQLKAPPSPKLSHGIQPGYISDCVLNSCLPGLLTICDKKVIQIGYPSTTLIQPCFHAFTTSGMKNASFMGCAIVELMALVNQLFAVSFITEPLMMYQLVSIGLDLKMNALLGQGQLLRSKLNELEKLRDVLYCENFNFMRFVKGSRSKLSNVPVNDAIEILHGYFKCTSSDSEA